MASMFRSGPSRRKAEAPGNIRIQFKGKTSEADNSDDAVDNIDSDDDDGLPVTFGNGVAQDSPEETGEETASRKRDAPARVNTDVLDSVSCTACGHQLNPYKNGAVQKHSELKVVICKRCKKFLSSGEISKDEDGVDEQCRWCGEGGRLLVCDDCSGAFCKACVMRNFGRSEFNTINNQDNWRCYLCHQVPLKSLQENYRKIRDTLKALHEREKLKSSGASGKTGSNQSLNVATPKRGKKADQNSVSTPLKTDQSVSMSPLDIEGLDIKYENMDATIDKLVTATTTLINVLQNLRQQSQLPVVDALTVQDRKKQKFKASLEIYFSSLKTILNEAKHKEDKAFVCPSVRQQTKSASSRFSAGTGDMTVGSVSRLTNNKSCVDIKQSISHHQSSAVNGDIKCKQKLKGGFTENPVFTKTDSDSSSFQTSTKVDRSSEPSVSKIIKNSSTTKNTDKHSQVVSDELSRDSSTSENEDSLTGSKNLPEKKIVSGQVSECHDDNDLQTDCHDVLTGKVPDKSREENSVASSVTAVEDDDENLAAKFDLIKELADEMLKERHGSDEENDDLPVTFGVDVSESQGKTVPCGDSSSVSSDESDAAPEKTSKSVTKGNIGKKTKSEQKGKQDPKNNDAVSDVSSSDLLMTDGDDDGKKVTRRKKRKGEYPVECGKCGMGL